MKTRKLFASFNMLKWLPACLVVMLLCIALSPVKSQEASSKSVAVYPTIGFGIGFFYPQDVNQFIKDEIISGYGASYNTDLYMYLELKGGVTVRLKKVDFSALLEYDIAPKIVMVTNGESFSFGYSRVSPEISANYYIPNQSGKNAFFIGGGVNYSFMSFKGFNASSPGFKLQAGYSMQFGKFNMQPYVAFRYSRATDTSDAVWGDADQNTEFTLDYIGGQIGIILSFHPRMLYK